MKINIDLYKGPCDCGKNHELSVQDILIEAGAISKVPHIIHERFDIEDKEISIICDNNTYLAAGQILEGLLNDSLVIILPPEGLHADNHAVKLAEDSLSEGIKLILAVGSGTVHDISRYIANKRGISFVSIPTAASVDGFVSTVAAMTWDGFKRTFPAIAPILVIADTNIFSKAPYRLTASGISDLLGKYTALADWEISHVVTGELFCNKIYQMEVQAIDEVIQCLRDLRQELAENKRLEAYEKLMYALLLSGIAMQMMGNSRPASGSEHHVSHLWEMEVINDHIDAYHGEKVSVGLAIVTRTCHKVKEALLKGNYKIIHYDGIKNSPEGKLLEDVFGPKGLYESVLQENTPDPLEGINTEELAHKIPDIIKILEKLPSEEEILGLLDTAGCIKKVQEIGLEDSIIDKTIMLSPYVRNRLTMMRLIKLFEFN